MHRQKLPLQSMRRLHPTPPTHDRATVFLVCRTGPKINRWNNEACPSRNNSNSNLLLTQLEPDEIPPSSPRVRITQEGIEHNHNLKLNHTHHHNNSNINRNINRRRKRNNNRSHSSSNNNNPRHRHISSNSPNVRLHHSSTWALGHPLASITRNILGEGSSL